MIFELNPYALIPFTATASAILLAMLIWSRRPGRGVIPFVLLALGLAIWSTANTLEVSATTLDSKVFFASLSYIGVVIVPVSWFIFVVEYTGREAWLNRRTLTLLAIEPVLVLVLVTTNSWHHLFWVETAWNATTSTVIYSYGVLFWLHAVYSYVLLLTSAVLLALTVTRSPQLYRGQITLMIVAQVAPWIANALYLAELSPLPSYLDLTPLGFVVTAVATAWSLYRYRLMDIVPVAHHEIFNSMLDAVLVFDAKNRVVDVNRSAAQQLRLPASAIIGKSAAEIFADQAHLISRYQNVESIDEELTIEDELGIRIYQISLSPIKDRSGQLTGRTVVLRDITQLKETNRQLVEARIKADEAARLKSEFLATMSHELRTPLNSILGYTGLMEMGVMGEVDEKILHAVKRIDESGQYLLKLINDILDLAKVEAGRIDIVEEPTDVREMVESWQEQISVLADNKGLDFTVRIKSDLPEKIYADRERLSQIAINLLSNAVKFTDEGGITLDVDLNGGNNWMIRVRDTGVGIAPDAQQYIFDEFRQVREQSKQSLGGTGLGLAIVRKLTNKMSGSVTLESELNKGSTFTVKLPLRTVDEVNDTQEA